MGETDEQSQPHICDCGFCMHKCLQTERENDCRSPADTFSSDAKPPHRKRQGEQRRCHCGWKTGGEIVLAKDMVASNLGPVGKRRLVEAKLIVEIWNHVIAAGDHLA